MSLGECTVNDDSDRTSRKIPSTSTLFQLFLLGKIKLRALFVAKSQMKRLRALEICQA